MLLIFHLVCRRMSISLDNEQHMCLFVLIFKIFAVLVLHLFRLFIKKEIYFMPKTLFQNIVFTLMMSFLMVYAMICYNISLNTGGMSNSVFLAAFHELIIMWPVAFLLEFLFVDKAAHALAFRFVKPDDRPIIITLAISTMIICIMCPCMSLVATILFKHAGRQFAAVWLQTTFLNFPVAFFWQLFYCGPFIRLIFRKLFPEK